MFARVFSILKVMKLASANGGSSQVRLLLHHLTVHTGSFLMLPLCQGRKTTAGALNASSAATVIE